MSTLEVAGDLLHAAGEAMEPRSPLATTQPDGHMPPERPTRSASSPASPHAALPRTGWDKGPDTHAPTLGLMPESDSDQTDWLVANACASEEDSRVSIDAFGVACLTALDHGDEIMSAFVEMDAGSKGYLNAEEFRAGDIRPFPTPAQDSPAGQKAKRMAAA